MKKADITPALVSRLLGEQFPHWAHLPVAPVALDGWDNTTFRLGAELAVRLPSADVYAAQVEKEHRWLPLLAPQLPLPIPEPVAKGAPGCGFPRPWSVYRWLAGEPATVDRVADVERLAIDLADFLAALYAIDTSGGPVAGEHSFFRGGPLVTYDRETREAIAALDGKIDTHATTKTWEEALAAQWHGPPVWVHGDITASNLLVVEGRLSAVIDFGCSAIGDPACDVAIAWTFFHGDARDVFRTRLPLDEAAWARGRGWALWKALVTLVRALNADGTEGEVAARRFGWRLGARQVIEEIVADWTADRSHEMRGSLRKRLADQAS
jgi:aminoglycoside phosphotransferase (APT) family kinase protein